MTGASVANTICKRKLRLFKFSQKQCEPYTAEIRNEDTNVRFPWTKNITIFTLMLITDYHIFKLYSRTSKIAWRFFVQASIKINCTEIIKLFIYHDHLLQVHILGDKKRELMTLQRTWYHTKKHLIFPTIHCHVITKWSCYA